MVCVMVDGLGRADEWKVRPGGRLRTLLERRAADDGAREVITVLGLRRDESASRAVAMTERRDSADHAVRSRTGALTISPMSEWTSDDVWTMLALLADAQSLPFPSPLMPRTIHRLSEIYRAGNGGTCGVVVGDSGARASCGSRFGCAICCVSGDRDKSLEAMIEDEQYGHLRPLNDFRNYLLAIQWDTSRRELVGRSLSDAGYTRIQADTYSYATRIDLLRKLLSIDAAERDRAEAHSGALTTGSIPDTEENRVLCEPQFEFVTPQQLVAIDFFLSMHHYAPHAFPALAVWHDVNVLGRRYPIPTLESLPKKDIVLHGWYPVGQYDKEAPVTGLRSFDAEQWNPYRHPGRPGSIREDDRRRADGVFRGDFAVRRRCGSSVFVRHVHVRHGVHAGHAASRRDRFSAFLAERGHREVADRHGPAVSGHGQAGAVLLTTRSASEPDAGRAGCASDRERHWRRRTRRAVGIRPDAIKPFC
ncbi:phosphoadenosine phosphosulfate reductase domain-containing protein [Caballeronia arationis]|uniref:phosphoadenosine phosphosulfate reductase domain-containing protein n=1 Tax=Caballeronia arationis TaxID=1777142 RepID=UPI002E0F8B1B|nr:phosphoadenosine phosphosulfate reductase family protein [Caballeronia arationis]